MAETSTLVFDRDLLTRRRDRGAGRAAAHDFLLQRVADDLADRLSLVRRSFAASACIGAYHGVLSRRLRQLPTVGNMIDMEAAPRLAALCDGPVVVADEELLPFAPASLDLAVSGLAFQHINDLPGTLAQIRRSLRPDGLLLAALLGGSTLTELRQAFVAADCETTGGASPRVAPFADVRDAGALLQRAGFALPVADTDIVQVVYPDAFALMRELKTMGFANALAERRRVFTCRSTLLRAAEIYARQFARADGRIIATFEIITMTGWAPHASQQQPLSPGSARVRLADALQVTEQPAGDKAPRR